MKKILGFLGCAVLLCSVACGKLPAAANFGKTVTNEAISNAVVADLGQPGGRAIYINMLAPQESGFNTQAVVHKWVNADICEYRATLNDGTKDLATIAVPQNKKGAAFTNLKQGQTYTVSVSAWGVKGGASATTKLNSKPAVATFDFTGVNDIENTKSASVTITFDQVAFNGTGTTTVVAPPDGTFQNPTEAETGTVVN